MRQQQRRYRPIHLATRLFAEPGDTVALEEPTYNNVLAVMRGLGLKTVPVPLSPSMTRE